MKIRYNKPQFARRLYNLQGDAYDKLAASASRAAAKPALTRTDSFIKLAKVTTLDSMRRHQFFRPDQDAGIFPISLDAVGTAVRSGRASAILPLLTPVTFGAIPAYALVGTGKKVLWAAPDSNFLTLTAAVLTQFGLLGLPAVVVLIIGRGLERVGLGKLAAACFAVGALLSHGVDLLRVLVTAVSFALQLPFTLIGMLAGMGLTVARAIVTLSLSPARDVNDLEPIVALEKDATDVSAETKEAVSEKMA